MSAATAVLDVRLDAPLPRAVAVGGGTAVFVIGSCFHPRLGITSLRFVVAGREQPVEAHSMPRLDLFRALHPGLNAFATEDMAEDLASDEDPGLRSYRSGFWGTVELAAGTAGAAEIVVRADLADGSRAEAPLATIAVRTLEPPSDTAAPEPGTGPFVAVCMATYDPPGELFSRQIESIRAQTHSNWVCLISDDCSSPERFAELEAEIGDDSRFVVSRSPSRLGFYLNFERALSMVSADVDFVAMADQDDVWHPDKLDGLLGGIGGAQLVYSDARIISRAGDVVADTYWAVRRNNHSNFSSLLYANSVTGAASLLRRELLDTALPFPPAQFAHFHDHWIGLVALALGEIAFVDRPLYDYVQHDTAVLGHAAANRTTSLRSRAAKIGEDPRDRVARWRMHYFVDNCRLTQVCTVLTMRGGNRIPAPKRRAITRFMEGGRSLPALLRLAFEGVPEFYGRPETLGAEVGLFFAFLWRRLMPVVNRGQHRPRRTLRLDSVPPPNLAPRPGRKGPEGRGPRSISEKVAPLDLIVRDDVPVRVNLLVPTIDLEHFFGGYIAKFNLARRLAERGHLVRIVTIDPVGPLPRAWKQQLEAYEGLEGVFGRIEVAFGREAQGLEVNRGDRFIASTWWSAHVAATATRSLDASRFLYLIQEYEPFTFPMGSYAALADESYRFDHQALFSTEFLREYFRSHRLGVFAAGDDAGDAASVSFENAITTVPAPTATELADRGTRRLLFYARPETHAARNMFELGVLALDRALELGAFADGWDLHGIGTTDAGRRISLGGGVGLDLLPRSNQGAYADVLRAHDVGLSLMYTPHPSLVPIEMASAGMLTVTNSFENKTAATLAEISSNLIAAEPGIEPIAKALVEASAAVGDTQRRADGAAGLRWSRAWDDSFDDPLMERIDGFLADS